MEKYKIYVVDTHGISDYCSAMKDKTFISIAEKQGGVYTLKGFERAFNYKEINPNTDVIRFIKIKNNGKSVNKQS